MKKALCILLCLSLVFALAACGGNASSTSSSDVSEAESAASTADSSSKAEETSAASGDGVTLTYWSMWGNTEPQAKAIQKVVDDWCAETGNTVNIEWKNRDIKTIIDAALGAKESIDIYDDDYQRIAQNRAEYCYDLTELADAAGYNDFAVEALPNAVKSWADGKLVTIAYQPYTSGIFYNKAIFEEAGITKDPQTWAEFLDACQKIKDAGYFPLAQDDAYVDYAFGYHLARYIGQDKLKEVSLQKTWADTPEVLQAAQDIIDLKTNGYLSDYAPGAYPEGENEIGYGETAMVVNASWVPQEITGNTDCDLKWGMFNYPTVEGGADPNTVANVGAQGFAVTSYSEHPEEAFDLIMALTSGEGDQYIATESNGIPADTRNEEWPEIISACREPFNSLTGVYDWNSGLTENSEDQTKIKDACLKLFEGEYTAQQFVDALMA